MLKTISDPGAETAARFGATIAPIGDRNSDGFIDLAVGAPLSAGGDGRVWTFTSRGPADTAFAGCSPSSGPGTGGKPSTGEPVGARILRRLSLRPSKRKLKRRSALRLSGSLKASASQAACQRRQKIAVQRRKLSGGRFQTFDVAVTTKTGSFRTTTRPSSHLSVPRPGVPDETVHGGHVEDREGRCAQACEGRRRAPLSARQDSWNWTKNRCMRGFAFGTLVLPGTP